MTAMFFYGTLRYRPLLELVLGHDGAGLTIEEAALPGHAAFWVLGESYPLIAQAEGRRAPGLRVVGLSAEDRARLDYYEGGHGYRLRPIAVELASGAQPAEVYFPPAEGPPLGAEWDLRDWQARWGDVTMLAAEDVMRHYGQMSAQAVAGRYGPIRARAASRLKARQSPPTSLRRAMQPDDVELIARRDPYAAFFAVEEYHLRHRRFDGAMGAELDRAAFITCDAATVLPYDPQRDTVLLVEQFRMGPYARGDAQCWSLEAIAGRIDAGETPEETLRREAREEAGLELGALHHCFNYYPSPGAVTEYIYTYVALADLPDSAAGLGGLMSEGEDIRAHVIAFDRLMALLDSGELENGPLITSALWLSRNRERLRAGA